jgi:NAD(P)-dependent dehydrogenase (short-subunit alcohol dehydrogenase family)
MQDFAGKVAVVTGAGSGIGRALARRFAREGCKLVVADISADALVSVAAEVEALGSDTVAVEVDVSDQGSVDALAARAFDAFGRVHFLCNNAGVGVPRGGGMYVWDTSLAEYDWVMGANVGGILHGCRAFVPALLAQDEASHILNTVSIAGLLTRGATHVYTMSKHAALSISESLVAQLAVLDASISVSILCPGFVDTSLAQSDTVAPRGIQALREEDGETAVFGDMRAHFEASIRNGMSPDDVADAAIAGVRAGRTYILTHPEYGDLAKSRVADIVDTGRLDTYMDAYRAFAARQVADE